MWASIRIAFGRLNNVAFFYYWIVAEFVAGLRRNRDGRPDKLRFEIDREVVESLHGRDHLAGERISVLIVIEK